MNSKKSILACLIGIALVAGCNDSSTPNLPSSDTLKHFEDWPKIDSKIRKDKAIEAEVARILSLMTLEEKVGQMIQPEFKNLSAEEARDYKIGSVLNGGGSAVNDDKHASAIEWAKKSDEFWMALEEAYSERGFKVPFMWATDAVHGNNNIYQSTIFPHNIGLGAARDSDLIYRIGVATAEEITATGIDWTFAPAVAVPRDYRWGRVYEGYSEDPEIVYEYAGKMVEGLQGSAKDLKSEERVIANVKVWIGDGGTYKGVDRGENRYTEEELLNIHGVGHISGLDAGAQVVMSSFNSWVNEANYDPMDGTKGEYNYKVHGSKYLIQDVLKGQMGFDGVVVTDWNGQQEINGCTASNCPQAVIAGNDILMTTANSDWKGLYHNIIAQVNDGTIPMSRIDDAVTRILRVKMRAGLWEKPMPSERLNAGKSELLGSEKNRLLAREAVSKSLVLLKNNNSVLPLSNDRSYYR
ncbi:glycoside hydrolase family 3 protein [Vibrio aestuarianus]|uniref:Glycoside hydrolase family 3 N-terminal domain-containing protein n=1 Tax=Vibrio aestuarianus TaxID=28171 RepID=A0A9X4FCR1_9VIBR|nr:glycoside hydrolase family 3 N-terminal domain-containing protein [Vibrio aestuarianus]MDE1236016.1 hypothetical protein [Vibrio aestuarianus]MDE1246894.1 hypothetical protein [Vibrio aestuarianus]MDE1347495.1 hypothetical protein [Vibrio aestuarianus]